MTELENSAFSPGIESRSYARCLKQCKPRMKYYYHLYSMAVSDNDEGDLLIKGARIYNKYWMLELKLWSTPFQTLPSFVWNCVIHMWVTCWSMENAKACPKYENDNSANSPQVGSRACARCPRRCNQAEWNYYQIFLVSHSDKNDSELLIVRAWIYIKCRMVKIETEIHFHTIS